MADSGASTPSQRFTAQAPTAEDLLKEQTVGLVHLSDFRKRRAEALDQVSRDATPSASGASTPKVLDGREIPSTTAFKKRAKGSSKTRKTGGGLSFGSDADEGGDSVVSPRNGPAGEDTRGKTIDDGPGEEGLAANSGFKKRLKPNSAVGFQPKVQTKSSLAREAELKEALRKEYAQIQEAVKETEFCLPFNFFDGKDAPGGVCRMKKGEQVWLFLERARKVGAESAGKGGAKGKGGGDGRGDWARISVDDLMVVRQDIILPHHYDFHYFIQNKSTGYKGTPLFSHSSEPTTATPQYLLPSASENATPPPVSSTKTDTDTTSNYLTTADARQATKKAAEEARIPDTGLEGFSDDPALAKVVDRRWYERNKHIYPASLWEEFDPEKDYSSGAPRKDATGNAYFFSR